VVSFLRDGSCNIFVVIFLYNDCEGAYVCMLGKEISNFGRCDAALVEVSLMKGRQLLVSNFVSQMYCHVSFVDCTFI